MEPHAFPARLHPTVRSPRRGGTPFPASCPASGGGERCSSRSRRCVVLVFLHGSWVSSLVERLSGLVPVEHRPSSLVQGRGCSRPVAGAPDGRSTVALLLGDHSPSVGNFVWCTLGVQPSDVHNPGPQAARLATAMLREAQGSLLALSTTRGASASALPGRVSRATPSKGSEMQAV